jgi:hypothetical protein
MAAEVNVKREGNRVHISLEMTLESGTAMLDYEEQIQDALNEAGVLATVACLETFDTDGSPILLGGTKLTSKGQVAKSYQTPYGDSFVERHVYQSSDGGPTFCPLEQGARIVEGTTPRFAKQCAFKYAVLNSVLAQTDLRENHRREVSRCYLQDIAAAVAAIAEAKEESWRYAEPELPWGVASVGVGIDGTCMLYCEEGWRQAMVGTITLYDVLGERMHTTYLAKPPEYGKEQFLAAMEGELERFAQRYSHARWVGVADGAHDQWPWLKRWTDQSILDFWHAASYLEKAAAGVAGRKQAARTQWFEHSRHQLKHEPGAARKLLREMQEALVQRSLSTSARKGLEDAITYFKNHLPKMHYARYRKEHLPIGSGVTEAACKTVVKQRLCGSGMKWKETGTATVLRLRCLVLTEGRWAQFWAKISRFGI